MPAPFFLHRPDIDDFVFIYTMGKVGSSSLKVSLENANIYCRRYHWITAGTEAFFDRLAQVSPVGSSNWNFFIQNRLNMRRSRSALKDRDYASLIKVITAIRAPLDQILSNYFQGLPVLEAALGRKGQELNAANIVRSIHDGIELYMTNPHRTIADLTRELTEENCDNIHFCWFVHNYISWFDEEFLPFFPVDILAGKLNHGFQVAGNVLILRFEDLSAKGERTVAAYAKRPSLKLIRENIGTQKNYGDLYRQVLGIIKFPAAFVDHLCSGPYVRHFYSEAEREAMRSRWIG